MVPGFLRILVLSNLSPEKVSQPHPTPAGPHPQGSHAAARGMHQPDSRSTSRNTEPNPLFCLLNQQGERTRGAGLWGQEHHQQCGHPEGGRLANTPRSGPCAPTPGCLPGIDNIPCAQFHHLFEPHGKYVSWAAVICGTSRRESAPPRPVPAILPPR